MIVSSFSWDVRVTEPKTWHQSKRFFFKHQYTTAFWLLVHLNTKGRVILRVYKNCRDEARATIRLTVNESFTSPEIIYYRKDFYEFPPITVSITENYTVNQILCDNVNCPLKIICQSITMHDLLSPPTQFDYWKQFHLNPEFSDFLVIIDNEKLPVHKLVLAAQSSVFSKMFTTDMKEATENQIEFKHDEADVMKQMIKYFYTGDTNAITDATVATKMLCVAHKYDVKHLTSICELTLVRNLSVKNVSEMLDIAKNYELAELCKQTLGFMIIQKNEVICSSDFDDIVFKHPDLTCQFIRLLNIECNRSSTETIVPRIG